MTITKPTLDEDRLNAFMGRFVAELGAMMHMPLVILGDRLGLYAALDDRGPSTSTELAEATGTHERYLREWLRANAAGGYLSYKPETDRYSLSAEQSFTLAQRESPAFIPGAFYTAAAMVRAEPRITEAFRSGAGFGWHEHHPDLFVGVESFFRGGYLTNIVPSWLPSLGGMVERLERGARVADVGCGHGASTILMAQAFPNSSFVGYDYHDASVAWATRAATEAGVGDRCRFEVAGAADYPGTGFDLVTSFDVLHDLGDPLGAARHVRSTLATDGIWMIVEPYAGDSVAENCSPVGRIYYSASTMLCVPNSLSQEVGAALGAQAGEQPIREVVRGAGFISFRKTAATVFNLVYEAR